MSHFHLRIVVTAAMLLTVNIFSASADQHLDQGLRDMAKKIHDFLEDEDYSKELVVGDFSGAPKLRASGGVEISRAIVEALRAENIKVHDDARYQLEGKFRVGESRQWAGDRHESLELKIEAAVLDENGEELAILPIRVFGAAALQIAGIDAELPPGASEAERQQTSVDQYRQPTTYIPRPIKQQPQSNDSYQREPLDAAQRKGKTTPLKVPIGYEVRPSQNSQFGMEILVAPGTNRADALVRPLRKGAKGRAYVELHQGEEYLVRLTNHSDQEMAVELTIDGVNVFQLAEVPSLKSSNVILAPHGSYIVPGWFRNLQRSNAFEIGGFAASVANQAGAGSASVGVITAKFRASWDPTGMPPPDEPGWAAKSASPPDKATVLGREVQQTYSRTTRKFGLVRAVVSIRYDK